MTNRNNNNFSNNISSGMNPFEKSSKDEYNEEEDRNLINKIGREMRPGGNSFGYMNLNGFKNLNQFSRRSSERL